MKLLIQIAELAGGLALIFLAIFRERKKPTWVRIAMGISGFFVMSTGALGIAYMICRAHSIDGALYHLFLFRTLCGGIFLGMTIPLFLSGNLRFTKRKKNPDSQSNQDLERSG